MTAPEACHLIVSLTRDVAAARAGHEAWRLFGLKVLHEYTALTQDRATQHSPHYRRIVAQLEVERNELLAPHARQEAMSA